MPLPRMIGINHVALEVGNVEAALEFYGRIFAFELRGSHRDDDGRVQMAFIDMGDQFLALSAGRRQGGDDGRHFGLVVDDRAPVEALALAVGARMIDGPFLDFLDPWGNRIEVVDYSDLQFSKTPQVLRAMGLEVTKSAKAQEELRRKGMA